METFNKVSEFYWWPGQRTFVKNYVNGCTNCQQFKIRRRSTVAPLAPIEGPKSSRPFANISADFITNLPPSQGHDSILSVVDHRLTKGVILIPCSKMITAEGTATLLLNQVYRRFGLPDKIISDRGPQFTARHSGNCCSFSTFNHL